MTTVPLLTTDRACLVAANGDYITAEQTVLNQPLVTPNASLTIGAFALRIGWWAIPALLVVGGGLIAWDVAAYLRAEWRARERGDRR